MAQEAGAKKPTTRSVALVGGRVCTRTISMHCFRTNAVLVS
jgi:hypothetical protein